MLKLDFLHQAFLAIDDKWQDLFSRPDFAIHLKSIDSKLKQLSTSSTIFPPSAQIFNAFALTKFNELSVVIVGQDPYHGDNEANGLAFAVNKGIKLPPSLKNILRELANQYNVNPNIFTEDILSSWARQGVLLLNSSLTVLKDKPNSLSKIGWQDFTDGVIRYISQNKHGLVFMLWGSFAQQKAQLIDSARHNILLAPHPSPLSVYRGFYGCNHFRLANEYLLESNKKPIDWLK